MWRGIEVILQGRDPRDAWAFCETHLRRLHHGACAGQRALRRERAGIKIPPNADIIRNIMFLTQMVQDHVIHFYHLHALDWVDVVSALKADPAGYGGAGAEGRAGLAASDAEGTSATWPGTLKKFVESGQFGIFAERLLGPSRLQASPGSQPDGGLRIIWKR
jgi:hydrogenase large subunit